MSEAGDLTAYEQRILQNVREHGCHITYVFDPDSDAPSFAYSAGFPETVAQPEVIIFGLTREIMHFMINELHHQCSNGLMLADGTELRGLLEGHRCIARAVPARAIEIEYFNSAMWLKRITSGEDMTSAIQVVWPGAVDGLFPWDDGCASDVRDLQPALYVTGLNS